MFSLEQLETIYFEENPVITVIEEEGDIIVNFKNYEFLFYGDGSLGILISPHNKAFIEDSFKKYEKAFGYKMDIEPNVLINSIKYVFSSNKLEDLYLILEKNNKSISLVIDDFDIFIKLSKDLVIDYRKYVDFALRIFKILGKTNPINKPYQLIKNYYNYSVVLIGDEKISDDIFKRTNILNFINRGGIPFNLN